MTAKRRNLLESLYRAAITLDNDRRAAFLQGACGDDHDLRRDLESRLAARHDIRSRAGDDLAGVTSLSPSVAPQPGTRLGPYLLEALLGEGGMGQVFRGRDTRLGRPVALKVVHADRASSPEFQVRFMREARATAALSHPHICMLYDVGEAQGASYIVMEYIEGQTLASQLSAGPLPVDRLLGSAREVALALAAAHERGIIHRDLKPANLMVTSSGIKVLDFGLAKFVEPELPGAAGITAAFTVVGTPAYMSPEQTRGEELDARSDVFSLGCVLYEAATGVRPFRGASVPDVLRAVNSSHPAPASTLRSELPSGWDAVLSRALAKDRDRRYQSAVELLQALDSIDTAAQPVLRTQDRQPDPLFGREKELQLLDGFLASALEGSGRVALVNGEPGIGKTSLTGTFVYDARRRHPDLLVARGACVEQHGAGEAYLPFLDALGSLLHGRGRERIVGLLRRYAPTWCLQFPAVFSSDAMELIQREATGATKDRMLRELGDAVAALTTEAPVLLFLEDLHWTDPASVDMLRHLAERARSQRLMMLCTARPEEIERPNHPLKNCYTEMHARGVCDSVPLSGLTVDDIAAYLDAHYSPNEFPHELATLIHRRSEGHPLFATGTIQILVEHGKIARANGAFTLTSDISDLELDVPVSVRSMIEKKIDLLTEEQRLTLQYASIEGEEFTSMVLGALLGADELALEERLAAIEKLHRLIRATGEEELPDGSLATRYRFGHALYQNFLYDQVLSKRRVLLHRQAGEAMERAHAGQAARIATVLATHFERGRDFSKAVSYLINAGTVALARYAAPEAIAHFTKGLELLDKLADVDRAARKATLLQKRAQALLTSGRLAEAGVDFAAMRDVCAESLDRAGECRALIGMTTVAHNLREVEQIDRFGREAMALAETIGDPALIADAGFQWAIYLGVTGRLTEAQSHWDRCIPLARSVNHRAALAGGLTYQGVKHFWQGEYERAEAAQVEAVEVATEVRDGFYLPLALCYLGLTRANRGFLSEALTILHRGLDISRRNNNGVASSRIPNGIGWVWREVGDLEKAIEFNEHSVEVSKRAKAAEAEANGWINLVYDFLMAGEPGRANDALQGVRPLYEREKWNRWRFYGIRHRAASADLYLAQGDLDAAADEALALLDNARANAIPKYTAIAHRLLGEIAARRGDHRMAEEEFGRALEPFAAHPAPLTEWRTHAALGRWLVTRNRPAAAREAYLAADALIHQLAAGITSEPARERFLNTAGVREVTAGAARP